THHCTHHVGVAPSLLLSDNNDPRAHPKRMDPRLTSELAVWSWLVIRLNSNVAETTGVTLVRSDALAGADESAHHKGVNVFVQEADMPVHEEHVGAAAVEAEDFIVGAAIRLSSPKGGGRRAAEGVLISVDYPGPTMEQACVACVYCTIVSRRGSKWIA